MAKATIAADLHQALDVLSALAMQVTLNKQVVVDVVTQLCEILFTEVANTDVWVYASLSENLLRSGQADAIDISQANFNALVTRKVNTYKTCHFYCSFPL